MTWVWEHSRSEGSVRLVLLFIADSADDDGDNAWPSVERIAKRCNVSERTVQYAIRRLIEMGELDVAVQAGGTDTMRPDRRPNRYRLLAYANGVQELHPAAGRGATGRATGCNLTSNGVQPVAPNPSKTHPDPSTDAHQSVRTPAGFAAFWEDYPRKVDKKRAEKAWRARMRAGVSSDDLLTALRGFIAHHKRAGTSVEFIMYPATFLGPDERWRDWLDALGANNTAEDGAPPPLPEMEAFAAEQMAAREAL